MIAPARDEDDGPKIDLKAVVLALAVRDVAPKDIGEKTGVPVKTVYRWINKAYDDGLMGRMPRASEFGVRLDCTCEDDPLRPGEKIVCVNCCASG